MSQLDTIVTVTVDQQTKAVEQASFGIPGIMAEFAATKTTPNFGRARVYADVDEMLAEGWVGTDEAVLAAKALLAQNPSVASFVVGRKDSADTDWATALTAISEENDTWYKFVICPKVPATPNPEFQNAAGWVATKRKQLWIQTTDVATFNAASTTDIGYLLKNANYSRTLVAYHLAANASERLDAAWLGEGAPFDPGSSNYAYKDLQGVTADKLTTAQKSVAWSKNVNTYTIVGGAPITEKGKMSSGEFADIIEGVDWIESRIQETVFGNLVNLRKLPYDDHGIQLVGGLLRGVLEEAGRKGILQIDSIEITLPKYADIPKADRIARHLPDVKFTALLQGAINTVAIKGTVSV